MKENGVKGKFERANDDEIQDKIIEFKNFIHELFYPEENGENISLKAITRNEEILNIEIQRRNK